MLVMKSLPKQLEDNHLMRNPTIISLDDSVSFDRTCRSEEVNMLLKGLTELLGRQENSLSKKYMSVGN
ncbi:MAG: hypothetical protein CM15mV26_0030 [uncultured marine virus]|nr:MAG: hypothetical protein CM15mV26_0030 [uncultured marine virus]